VSGSLHEQFDRPEMPLPSDRSTGLVFAGVAVVVAFLWRHHTPTVTIALGLAVALAAVSFLMPSILRPLNILWMRFAVLLSKVMNPIVMMVLFAIAIVPAGLIMQLKRDPLRRRKGDGTTYWLSGDHTPGAGQSSMKNQF